MEIKTKEQHKQKHIELHKCLDELVADFIVHKNLIPSSTSIMELIGWSYEQTKNPTDIE